MGQSEHWLVKQEPDSYSWSDFLRDGKTAWTGVRNFQARNNLRDMRSGHKVLFYHSVSEKAIVGVAEVIREAYPDPTAKEGDWTSVDLAPVKSFKRSVGLDVIKNDSVLREMALVRQSRLSVTPVTPVQFRKILELAETKI